jgi:hypothetical protein
MSKNAALSTHVGLSSEITSSILYFKTNIREILFIPPPHHLIFNLLLPILHFLNKKMVFFGVRVNYHLMFIMTL